MFKSYGFKIRKAYCEDVKHSLNDFGFLPWFKYSRETHNFSLSSFKDKTNVKFAITDEEINSFKYDPSLKPFRMELKELEKRFLHIRLPAYIPIGHQQYLFAEKI